MESLSIIGSKEYIEEIDEIKHCGHFNLEKSTVNIGLVTENDLNISNVINDDDRVVVRKTAFSCNYRDKTLILHYNKEVQDMEADDEITFSYMGSEFVGEVIEIGKNVNGLKIGDRVIPNIAYPSYTKGYVGGIPSNHASRRIDDFKENKLVKIPDSMPDAVAAAFPIAAFTTYSMIRKVVFPNARVLVTSARSNTSLAVISALRNFPVEVYAITSSHEDHDILYNYGVKKVFVVDRYEAKPEEGQALVEFTRQNGLFNAVIDPMSDIYLERVLKFMDYDSKYVTCGLYDQYADFSVRSHNERPGLMKDIIMQVLAKNISIIGNCIGLEEDFNMAVKHYEEGKFDILIDEVFTIGEEICFFEKTYNSSNRMGKVVFSYV
ncbi:MAG: zinc-binding alcohol dehydrogenase family protein [Chryseobacterium sp.]|nr:zinc-binding alcohol dehydrogenase family protein [Chryseobacterium sp.]MDN5479381.1 zinc-binding alcohol dehydrogenase family protein [Chryseobacterium sp.]